MNHLAMRDLLTKARAYIESGWVQFVIARDAHGEAVDATDSTASSFCMLGALTRSDPENFAAAYQFVSGILGTPVSQWNDRQSRSKEDVLDAFDKAIYLCTILDGVETLVKAPIQWEYQHIQLLHDIDGTLASLGAEGWEMVGPGPYLNKYVFKRIRRSHA